MGSTSLISFLDKLGILQETIWCLPMILGSFIVTILSALIATPFAIGAAVFMTEVSPKGANFATSH